MYVPLSLLPFFYLSLTDITSYGTFLFNSIVSIPICIPRPRQSPLQEGIDVEEAQGLLANSIDETAALPADLGQSGYDVVPQGISYSVAGVLHTC